MDTQGKPTYQASDCEPCSKREQGYCGKCTKRIPQYAVPSGSASPVMINGGFRSPIVDHWHFKSIEGVQGLQAIVLDLCRECYLEDYTEKYPDRKLELKELPKEISYN